MTQFPTAQLCEVAEIVMGTSPPGHLCNKSGVGTPLLNGPTEFGPRYPTPVQFTTGGSRFAEQGDLLFCVRGSTTGRMNWADQKYALGRGLAAFRHKQGNKYQPFVFAVVRVALQDLLGTATGSTFPSVSKPQLHKLPVSCPPLPEQRAIASILGALDDKIDLNRRMNETLEEMARALFKSWFVDFDPVRAKAEGKQPYGMDAETAALFPDRLVDSELGPIPEGWEIGTLGEFVNQRLDRCKPSNETESIPYVPIDCIEKKSLALSESKPGSEARSSLTRFEAGDILFGAMRPYFHKVCIAPFNGTTRTTVFVLYPREADDFSFAAILLSNPETIEFATQHSTGSTIPYATWSDSLETMRVVSPVQALRRRFDSVVRPSLDILNCRFFENRTLAELRDLLLPKLLSGEIRVKDAEKIVEDAV